MVFPQRNHTFYKIVIFRDMSKNSQKIMPKSSQNAPQTSKNRAQITKNPLKKPRRTKTTKKHAKIAEISPYMAPRPFQEEGRQKTAGVRGPLPADHFS